MSKSTSETQGLGASNSVKSRSYRTFASDGEDRALLPSASSNSKLKNTSNSNTQARPPFSSRSSSNSTPSPGSAGLNRKFSIWSIIGVGFSLTNSWFGVASALATGINSGGPVLLVYGLILMFFISMCVGVSLSELASAMPNSGGQYFWTRQLAPKKYADLAGFVVGWISWMASVFTAASGALVVAYGALGCWQLVHVDFAITSLHVFVTFQIVNFLTAFLNIYGHTASIVATSTLWISIISFWITLITIPSVALSSSASSSSSLSLLPLDSMLSGATTFESSAQSASEQASHLSFSFIFTTFINNTGMSSPFLVLSVGLINTNWAFACIDCATHLAEEVDEPERNIPKAILGTVCNGFVTAFLYIVVMLYSVPTSFVQSSTSTNFNGANTHPNNGNYSGVPIPQPGNSMTSPFEKILKTPTGVPILELFNQVFRENNKFAVICLEILLMLAGTGSLAACHTWQSRLCWSFSRDAGLPFSHMLSRVNKKLDSPLNAHIFSNILVSIVGIILLVSSTAFNSLVTACITLLYVSYAIPVSFLLWNGRDTLKRGPFWLGSWGKAANLVLLFWTVWCAILYSFPVVAPVRFDNMNYVCVVYALVAIVIALDWQLRGRKQYVLPE